MNAALDRFLIETDRSDERGWGEDMDAYEVGDRVTYRSGFGDGPEVEATIIGTGEKNDRPLVDLDNGHWAYLDQITGRAT